MFKTKSLNLIVISIVVIIVVTAFAIWLLVEPSSGIVLAQGGKGENPNAALQEFLANQDLNNTIVTPFDGDSGFTSIGTQSDGSGVEVVPTGAFRHNGDNPNGYRHYFAGGYLRTSTNTEVCFMAPTYPPIGTEVTSFAAAILDNDATANIPVALFRVPLANTSGAEGMAGVISAGQNASSVVLTDNTIVGGTELVTDAYAYFVAVCIPDNADFTILFYGAGLGYICPPIGESDNINDALTINSGQTVCGQVGPADIDDVYQIQVLANQEVTVQMTGAGGDADLYLYPPGTTDVTTDPWAANSTNTGNKEFIQGTALAGGFWYVDIYAYSGTSNYFVTVTLSGPPPIKTQTFNLVGGETGNRAQK